MRTQVPPLQHMTQTLIPVIMWEKKHMITPLKGQSNYKPQTPGNRLILICSLGCIQVGGIWAITSWSSSPKNHSVSPLLIPTQYGCSLSRHHLLCICSWGRSYWGSMGPFPSEANCHSTPYDISFFPGSGNWCSCSSAQKAMGLGGWKKDAEGKEETVHRQKVCLHRAFLMRSHELSASAASDKHTSDATGKGRGGGVERWISSSSFLFQNKMKTETLPEKYMGIHRQSVPHYRRYAMDRADGGKPVFPNPNPNPTHTFLFSRFTCSLENVPAGIIPKQISVGNKIRVGDILDKLSSVNRIAEVLNKNVSVHTRTAVNWNPEK